MAVCIGLGNIDKNIIFLLLGGLGLFFGKLIPQNFGNNLNPHPLIIGINAALGMSLSIFPFIFVKISTRKKHSESQISQEKLIYTNTFVEHYDNMRRQKYLLILLSCFLDYGQKILSFAFITELENNFWIFDIFFVNLFSIFILKTKLYIFQYLSLSIIIILGIILNVINLYSKLTMDWLNLLTIALIEIMYSLKNVINKYSMDYNYCLPYEIGFYEGFFALIINIILLKFTDLDKFSGYFEIIDKKEIIIFLILMISRWFFNLFGFITVKIYTVSHIVLILIIGEISFSFSSDDDKWKLYSTFIIFIILFFMLLVFTEIIELNCCELQKDTKKNISERARLNEMRDTIDSYFCEENERFSNLSYDNNNTETKRKSIND